MTITLERPSIVVEVPDDFSDDWLTPVEVVGTAAMSLTVQKSELVEMLEYTSVEIEVVSRKLMGLRRILVGQSMTSRLPEMRALLQSNYLDHLEKDVCAWRMIELREAIVDAEADARAVIPEITEDEFILITNALSLDAATGSVSANCVLASERYTPENWHQSQMLTLPAVAKEPVQ